MFYNLRVFEQADSAHQNIAKIFVESISRVYYTTLQGLPI